MLGYFDELSAAVARADAEEEVAAIATRHAMEVVGPIPDSYV